jgi:hypothetical protein
MTPEQGDLPAELDPLNQLRTGAKVLDSGLPELPGVLTYQMSIPVCYWTAATCGVVAFLHFRRFGDSPEAIPMTTIVSYAREADRWRPPGAGALVSWSYAFDPIAQPGYARHLDGNALTYGETSQQDHPRPGQPACYAMGYVAPVVTYLAVLQDGHQERRTLQSRFGAWIVCTDQPGSFDVAAYDQEGSLLACLEHPFPRSRQRRRAVT